MNLLPEPDNQFQTYWARGDSLPGWFSTADAHMLWGACKLAAQRAHDAGRKPRFVEIGSYRGRSSTLLMGHYADVLLIEPFYLATDRKPGDDGTKEVEFEYRSRVINFEALVDLKDNLAGYDYVLFTGESRQIAPDINFQIDLIHIDGDHGKGGVDVDVELWLPKLYSGGFALFHDYEDSDFPTIKEAVDLATLDWPIWEIASADITLGLIAREKPDA